MNMRLTCTLCLFIQVSLLLTFAYSQQPEINDQFVTSTSAASTVVIDKLKSEITVSETPNTTTASPTTESAVTVSVASTPQYDTTGKPEEFIPESQTTRRNLVFVTQKPNCLVKLYESISNGVDAFVSTPKVNTVLKNIGVCIVNGVMEIITFYIPAPFIPLIASAAGMIIPFEPVVMLKQRLPMRNYRRALNSAVNSFLGTFDRFAVHNDDDPYMTRRFNRRFMGNSNEELSTKRNAIFVD